jgi:hypothetical protein
MTAGRTRRDSTGKVRKTAFVNTTNTVTTTAPANRARAATFVQDSDLAWGRAKKQTGTQNPVTRTKLRSGGAPPVVSTDRTVFFKRHDNADAPSQYSVASTRTARFLGMPTVIAHNAFARIKGVPGVVSGRVPGKPLQTSEFEAERAVPADYSAQDIQDWMKGSQIVKRGGRYYETSAFVYQYADLTDPQIQKGFSDLQLFDAITGQVDRHGGNVYIDPQTGAVTGIDDDRSFGVGRKSDDLAVPGGKYLGLPELVDKTTANRILNLSPNDLAEVLRPYSTDGRKLTAAEITDARRRLVAVQTHLQGLKNDGRLVTTWDDATYQEALRQPGTSYLGRHAADLADGLAGNPLGGIPRKVVGAPPGVTEAMFRPAPVPVPAVAQPVVQQQRAWQAPQRPQRARPVANRMMLSQRPAPPPARAVVTPEQSDETDDGSESLPGIGDVEMQGASRALVTLSDDDEVFLDRSEDDVPPDVLSEVDE